jgi:cytochrome c
VHRIGCLLVAGALLAACTSDDSTARTDPSAQVEATTSAPADGPSPSTATTSDPSTTASPESDHVLVLTKTAGFRHTSIEPAVAALVPALEARGIAVTVDPDATQVTDDGLAPFDAVVMLSTTGDWLDDAQQGAIERWAADGGAVAGIHAATDAEPDWVFLDAVFGVRFAGHPAVQPAIVRIEDPAHPAMAGLPPEWTVTDEWYDFTRNPRAIVHVLATVDEATYTGGSMGPDHPIEWSQEPTEVAGRAWYTAMGHADALWSDPLFVAHVAAGIAWTVDA